MSRKTIVYVGLGVVALSVWSCAMLGGGLAVGKWWWLKGENAKTNAKATAKQEPEEKRWLYAEIADKLRDKGLRFQYREAGGKMLFLSEGKDGKADFAAMNRGGIPPPHFYLADCGTNEEAKKRSLRLKDEQQRIDQFAWSRFLVTASDPDILEIIRSALPKD